MAWKTPPAPAIFLCWYFRNQARIPEPPKFQGLGTALTKPCESDRVVSSNYLCPQPNPARNLGFHVFEVSDNPTCRPSESTRTGRWLRLTEVITTIRSNTKKRNTAATEPILLPVIWGEITEEKVDSVPRRIPSAALPLFVSAGYGGRRNKHDIVSPMHSLMSNTSYLLVRHTWTSKQLYNSSQPQVAVET